MKRIAAIVLMVLAAILLASTPGEGISCGEVQGSLTPCLDYLTGSGDPSGSCCGGVRSLAGSLQSQLDRQTACYCIKSAASSFNVRSDAAADLPGKCGVSVGVTVDANIDCTQVS